MGSHPRHDVEEQANDWLRRQPPSITDHIPPTYCTRRYGNIVQCKAKNDDDLQMLASDARSNAAPRREPPGATSGTQRTE